MGYISCLNKNKTALSQFTKNLNIGNSRFMGKEGRFGKSRFTANMEIMIHVGKIAISHFNGKEGSIAGHENTFYNLPHTQCQLDTLHFLAWQRMLLIHSLVVFTLIY